MRTTLIVAVLGLTVVSAAPLAHAEQPSKGAYIISPTDGARVSSPVTVRFGLSGKGVAPAGVDIPGTGHHHLIIDSPLPALDETIPKDEYHRHFGKGQTEAAVDLPPGTHTLQLLLGDHAHVPHSPPDVSGKIVITVE
jgi:hypothetical protein